MKSYESPEIPDVSGRAEGTSDIPGLPSEILDNVFNIKPDMISNIIQRLFTVM